MHHVETTIFHIAAQKSPVELTVRSATPSEGACPNAAERFQNSPHFIYPKKHQMLSAKTR